MPQTTKSKATPAQATTANTTARTSTSQATIKLHARDRKVIAADSAYAIAGLGHSTVHLARTLPGHAQTLLTRDELARRIRAGRNDLGQGRKQLEQRVRQLRNQAEQRVRQLRDQAEQRFDQKATEGRTVVDHLLQRRSVKQFVQQAKTARSKVKAATTSLRKTAGTTIEAGVAAGREQAATAKSQTKAAATSVQKTAAAAVEVGRELAS